MSDTEPHFLTEIAMAHAGWSDDGRTLKDGTVVLVESELFIWHDHQWAPVNQLISQFCLTHADCRASLKLSRACYDARRKELETLHEAPDRF